MAADTPAGRASPDPGDPGDPDDARGRHERTTAMGEPDPLGATQAVVTGAPITGLPPAMPAPTLPTQAAVIGAPITSLPPAMPAPTMPTQAAVIGAPITSLPPEMPVLSGAPTLPTQAIVTGAPITSLPPAMPAPTASSMPAESPALSPLRYVLGSEIARGGMGRVVDATDTLLGRVVAFKEALTTDSDALRRFEREIRITARLEHPSIVPVHDAGASGSGAPFYVMRKVSGRPLERLVAVAETLGQRLALIPHIVNSAQAVAHAHERGIVHRDIKPSNILVGDLGETVVIDWGLAKVIGEPDEPVARPLVDLSDTLKTRAGIVFGTPGFMAPEQLRGAPVNEGCDVYALGATLYHLLSRKPPHYAKTADEMMKAAAAAAPTPIRELVDGVPLDLAAIVDKALAHDPRVRYQNARSLAEDLQLFLTGQLVAAHHYSTREKLVRFVRKNRGVSAAVVALLVVGAVSVVRILGERDRADAAAHVAEVQRAEAVRRAEELTLAHARDNVDLNPTKAVAMLKPLAARYWREARAIAAAARASGVAWGVHASKHSESLEMSRDGLRALSAGSDGVIRLHDLAHRTTRTVAELHGPISARFADAERRIAAWHDRRLVILDAGSGASRELTTASPIAALDASGDSLYWVDDDHALWQLALSAAPAPPTEIALDEPVVGLSASPDGRWIALAGEGHLFLYDRTQPALPPMEVMLGTVRGIGWTGDGEHFAALVDRQVIDVSMVPAPSIVHIVGGENRMFVAHSGQYMYAASPTDVGAMRRTDSELRAVDRKPLRGDPVGLALARGGTVVAGATAGLTVISDDGDRVLPLQAAHVERVVASPRSPYVIAQLAHRLLVWNLDDIQPRRLAEAAPDGALFAGPDRVITGGVVVDPGQAQAQSIDVATGAAQPLAWTGLRAVAATDASRVAAIVDGDRRVHLIGTDRAAHDLPGAIDIAGFATADKLVLATLDGAISQYDVTRGALTPLVTGKPRLLGLAWGRGHHPWVAAAFLDGTLWRKNVTTGAEATIARVPHLDAGHVTPRDGKLIALPDGTVAFLHDNEVHLWRADGVIERLATLPKPLDDFGEAGPDHVIAFATDTTVYAITRAPLQITEAIPGIEGTGAAMSPDTGLLVVIEHGALDVLDPLVRQRWTLAPPGGIKLDSPTISANGRRVLARTQTSLLVWSIDLPAGPAETAAWLDAMTNAIDDPSPGGIGWR